LPRTGLGPVTVEDWFDVPHRCARRYFQDGVPGLDYPRSDLPANVSFVGPLLAPGKGLPEHVLDRVRNHPTGVVVVSQGTVDNEDPSKLIVPALEALKNGPNLVVVTTGGSHTDELRVRFPYENVLIEDYLDYGDLFDHADAFICNGGYGSVMSALAHGVPVLAAGKREGKNDINARLDHLDLGIDLKSERSSARQVRRGVGRLLHDQHIRRNVERVRAELGAHRPLDIVDRCLVDDGFLVTPTR
jgi:UDP:flavonoid glycosyltransferase YjiC (YdhE family)